MRCYLRPPPSTAPCLSFCCWSFSGAVAAVVLAAVALVCVATSEPQAPTGVKNLAGRPADFSHPPSHAADSALYLPDVRLW